MFFVLVCFPSCAHAVQEPDWGVLHIGATCVWDKNQDNSTDQGANCGDVIVAVIDDEFDIDHEDLKDNIAGGRSFELNQWGKVVEGDDYGDNPGDHGTACAGIIAAVDNQIGIIGTAPKAKIYALRIKSYDASVFAYAINYSVCVLGAEVVSMSWYWDKEKPEVTRACEN